MSHSDIVGWTKRAEWRKGWVKREVNSEGEKEGKEWGKRRDGKKRRVRTMKGSGMGSEIGE